MRRRRFIQGCCAGIAAMSGVRLNNLVFADPSSRGSAPADIIISVFLRGGMDALSFLVPIGEGQYYDKRPQLGIAAGSTLAIRNPGGATGQFGLHPRTSRLKELVDSNNAAVVCACGSPSSTRSHFEAMDYMERGKPDDRSVTTGWLARYLTNMPGDSLFRGFSRSESVATSLSGYAGAVAMTGASGFTLQGSTTDHDDLRRALRKMYVSDAQLRPIVERTLDAVDYMNWIDPGTYTPPAGVTYPGSSFGSAMASIAQMIRFDLGLQAVTVDLGGWDTHESQANGGSPTTGQYSDRLGDLFDSLHAFWSDLTAYRNRITVVVMSEFGRRLRENDNRGTDHGHGGTMVVLNGALQQGRVYGSWPGLAPDQLFDDNDLQVTTDFRTVLTEILIARAGLTLPGLVFPDFTYPGPTGLFGAAGILPAQPSAMAVR